MNDRVEEEAVEPGGLRLAARRHGAGEHRDEVVERRREDKLIGDEAEE